MKTHQIVNTALIASLLSVITWQGVRADYVDDIEQQSIAVSLIDAIQIALQQSEGTAIEAELEKEDGVLAWEVAVLGADKAVTEVYIDAASGTVLDVEVDDD